MYITLSDEAMTLVNDLVSCGIHGDHPDRVVETLILDQLKYLIGLPGWSDLFERKRYEREEQDRQEPAPF